MRRPTVPPALTQGPFTIAQAAEHGVTRGMLESPVWRPIIRGVYVHAGVPDTRELRARAAGLLLDPRVFLCGISAAWLYGVDLHPLKEPLPSLWIGCHNNHRLRTRAGWKLREITVAPRDLTLVAGVRVTSAVRTCFDCARWLSLTEATVVLDCLAHRGLVTPGQVTSYADAQRGIRHKRRVPAVADLSDPRAESPPETRLRLMFVFAGLRPVPQYILMDGETFVARIDLAFADAKVAVEYEGKQHAAAAAADERRRAAIESMGWVVIRVYAEDLASEIARRALLVRVQGELLRRSHGRPGRPTAAPSPAEVDVRRQIAGS